MEARKLKTVEDLEEAWLNDEKLELTVADRCAELVEVSKRAIRWLSGPLAGGVFRAPSILRQAQHTAPLRSGSGKRPLPGLPTASEVLRRGMVQLIGI